jgi:hypothetical protein
VNQLSTIFITFAAEFDFYVRKVNEEKENDDPAPSWLAGCYIVYQHNNGVDIIGSCGVFRIDGEEPFQLCEGELDGNGYAGRYGEY